VIKCKDLVHRKETHKIVCFDLDGTITGSDNFPEFVFPANSNIVTVIRNLYKKGYYIIINSSRDTIYYDAAKHYLETAEVPYNALILKAKPTADYYVDDKSPFLDSPLLEALIELHFLGIMDFARQIADERLQNSFSHNIYNVPQYPDFHPEHSNRDENFRVYLAISGGMDSFTLHNMLMESGTKFESVFFNIGDDSHVLERKVIGNLIKTPIIDLSLEQWKFERHDYILSGRNVVIILLLAHSMQQRGHWGEIWMGNLQGESPDFGGDKSRRFFNDMNILLAMSGYDARIVNPLIGFDKFDEVVYWKDRGRVDELIATKSCFSDIYFNCGQCQSCFRKYIAFLYNGIDIGDIFEQPMKFEPYIEKYKIVMTSALINQDFRAYSKMRCERTLEAIRMIEEK